VKNSLWFKKKTYGWGWTPVNLQGWLVIAAYFLAVCGYALLSQANVVEFDPTQYAVIVLICSVTLIAICYKKGEKPSWSWGKRK
jgi:hypothetical protein